MLAYGFYTIYTNGHRPLLLYKSYTSDTHGVKAFQSYTAKQRYTVYSYYTAIHRYTLYTLYNTPLEVTGVDKTVLDACDAVLEIPVFGVKNSLNVACCASIVLYEVSCGKQVSKSVSQPASQPVR